MNEKIQIVDNPLLLTSLFSEGVFYIPTENKVIAEEVVKVENQQVEVSQIENVNVEIEQEITQNIPEIKKIELQNHLNKSNNLGFT